MTLGEIVKETAVITAIVLTLGNYSGAFKNKALKFTPAYNLKVLEEDLFSNAKRLRTSKENSWEYQTALNIINKRYEQISKISPEEKEKVQRQVEKIILED